MDSYIQLRSNYGEQNIPFILRQRESQFNIIYGNRWFLQARKPPPDLNLDPLL